MYSIQNKKAEQTYFHKKVEAGHYDTAEDYEDISHLFSLDQIHRSGELVLDAGCGTDAFGIRLAKRGYRAIGIDISRKECEFVLNRTEKEGVCFPILIGDLEGLPFKSESFDNIFCGAVLHHFHNFNPALEEMIRILKKGGRIILVDPNGSNPLWGLYFLANRLSIRWFKRRGYLTINERLRSVKAYSKALEKREVNEIKVHILKINKSVGIKKFLINLWSRLLPSTLGGTTIVITGTKF
jgi:SAM-dependent methyltransferase